MNKEKFSALNHCLNLSFEEEKQGLLTQIRKRLFEKLGIWDIFDLVPYRWRMYYYDFIKPIFKPHNSRIRKSIPKTWSDVSHLIVQVNFEFIKSFYEEEFKADIVDWTATEEHKEFSEWLEQAYQYVTKLRPTLEKELENSYPPSKPFEEMFKQTLDKHGKTCYQLIDDGIPYEVKYADVNRIEKQIDDRDTEILTEIIKRRMYFWT